MIFTHLTKVSVNNASDLDRVKIECGILNITENMIETEAN